MNALLIFLFSPIGLTRIIYITLIVCSAAVTAYFGKEMGGDFILVPQFDLLLWTLPDLRMSLFTAAGFFAISVASAVFAYHAGHMRALNLPEWRFVMQFALFLLVADIFTNYMSWATIRTGKAVVSQNANVVADKVRSRLSALVRQERDLTNVISAPGAWIAVRDAEKALDDTIKARDREKKRVRCGPLCEELDLKARNLRIEISKSRTRERAIEERKIVREQISKLRSEMEVKQTVVDPTAAQNTELASSFTGMDPSESAKFVAAKVIGLVGAVMFSLSASACGILLGLLTGRAKAREESSQDDFIPAPLAIEAPAYSQNPLLTPAEERSAAMQIYRSTTTIEKQRETAKNRRASGVQRERALVAPWWRPFQYCQAKDRYGLDY